MNDYQYPIITVGGLIVASDGEVLLVKSHKWNACYTVPGGKVEYGETREMAFIREVKEETGLELANVRFITAQDSIFSPDFKEKRHFIMNDFIADLAPGYTKSDVKLNDEAEEYLWISPEKAKSLSLNRELYRLLDLYLEERKPKGWTLVTGAGKRLGAEICRNLAKEGYNVVIHYNKSKEEAALVAQECRKFGVLAETIQGDFSSSHSVETFAKEYLMRFPNTVNLVNNIGNFLVKSFSDTSLSEMEDLYQTNFFAPYLLIQKLLPSIKNFQGNIVNIGFVGLNSIKSHAYASAYSLTKSSLLLLTKTLAKELCAANVRVNMVSPGYLENAVDLPENISSLPMKRAGKCEEVAHVVSFFLNKKNSYITGQNIEVAGGVQLS